MQKDWQRFIEQQLMNIQKQNEMQSEILFTIQERVNQMDNKLTQHCEIIERQDERIDALEQNVSKHSMLFKIIGGGVTLLITFIAAAMEFFRVR